jgi:hypothetical protein
MTSSCDMQFLVTTKGMDASARLIIKKGKLNGIKTHVIDLTKEHPNFSILKIATEQSKIIFNGHCNPGSDRLRELSTYEDSSRKSGKPVEYFTDLLFTHAPQLKSSTSASKRVKISVIGCFSAVDDGENRSFSYRLSRLLSEKEDNTIHATVNGYNNFVMMHAFGKKKVGKLVGDLHHEKDGYKSSFVTEKGVTIRHDYRKKECEKRTISPSVTAVGLGILSVGILLVGSVFSRK